MEYSAIHRKIIIDKDNLDRAIEGIRWSMKKFRKAANAPLGKRKTDGILGDIDQAEHELLSSLKEIGIDFGTTWGNTLDLSDEEN